MKGRDGEREGEGGDRGEGRDEGEGKGRLWTVQEKKKPDSLHPCLSSLGVSVFVCVCVCVCVCSVCVVCV